MNIKQYSDIYWFQNVLSQIKIMPYFSKKDRSTYCVQSFTILIFVIQYPK